MSDKESSSSVSEAVRKSRGKPLEFFERPSKVSKFDASAGHGEEVEDHGELIEKNMNRSPGIQRYLIAVEYIGTRFAGAQKQPSERTVVGVLEEAFQKFIGQPVSIFCSSRTDAGVHALSNVCHVDIERISKRKPGEVLPPHEPSVVNRAVNHFLQKKEGDITVTDVRYVPIDFHARYKALERVYFYKLLSGKEPLSAFDRDRVWHVPQELNLSAMKKACDVLIGRHDFSSFRSAACQAKSPIINLDELTVTEVASSPFFPNKPETEGPDFSGFGTRRPHRGLVIKARGRSFLYHQVRLMVGVLKAVGTGDLAVSDVERILEAKNIAAASPMAPACGLYLAHVKYDLPCNQ